MTPSKDAVQRSRRGFTPEQKATILRRPLGDFETTMPKKDRIVAEVSEEYLDMKPKRGAP
jgi:hypothetical protein